MVNNFSENSAYLFYDTDFRTLNCPFVLDTNDYTVKDNAKSAEEKINKSFSIKKSDMYDGLPLSSFIIFNLLENTARGQKHSSLSQLVNDFRYSNRDIEFNGRLAILSIGKKIDFSINNDGGLQFND